MDIYKTIKKRRSVRSYKKEPVPKEKLKRILDKGVRLAPSASNRQDYKFVIVTEEKKRKKLGQAAAGQTFVGQAPVVIAAVSLSPERLMSCGVPAYAVDLGIALDHLTLAAAREGLGTCWIGAFSQSKVKQILDIPKTYKVAALMPLGVPAQAAGKKIRKDLTQIICKEKFE